MTLFLFLGCLFLFFYAYALYPLVLAAMGLFVRARATVQPLSARVSIVISAYNEEAVIGKKLQNALSLDYPRDLLEILVSFIQAYVFTILSALFIGMSVHPEH